MQSKLSQNASYFILNKFIKLSFFLFFYSSLAYAQFDEPKFRGRLALAEEINYSAINISILFNDPEMAIIYGQAALNSAIKTEGKNSLKLVKFIDNLATYYSDEGDFLAAEKLYNQSIQLQLQKKGHYYSNLIFTYLSFGESYNKKQDFNNARNQELKALKIARHNKDDDYIRDIYSILSEVYLNTGNLDSAEIFIKKGWELAKKTPTGSPDWYEQQFATLAFLRGKKPNALFLYKKSLDSSQYIRSKRRFDSNPSKSENDSYYDQISIKPMQGLSISYLAENDTLQAFYYLKNALELGNDYLNDALGLKPKYNWERPKRSSKSITDAFVNAPFDVKRQLDMAISFQTNYLFRDSQTTALTFSTILQRKGIQLDTYSYFMSTLLNHIAPDQRSQLDSLNRIRFDLNQLKSEGTEPTDLNLWQSANDIETYLLGSLIDSSNQNDINNIDLKKIQKALPEKSAMIEFISYHPLNINATNLQDQWKPSHYAGYILTKEGNILHADLGAVSDIDSLIDEWRETIYDINDNGSIDTLLEQTLTSALYAKLIQPFSSVFVKTDHLFISPDGKINILPIAALQNKKGHYLIEDLNITYFSSARDFLNLSKQKSTTLNKDLFILNPDFGVFTTKNHFNKNGITQLPETQMLADTLKELNPDVQIMEHKQASVEAINNIHRPRILLIATHGYSPENISYEFATPNNQKKGEKKFIKKFDNPFLRCGLLLAGANELVNGHNQGILSGLEISGLNLQGTELVILSACQTGTGDIQNGEGVYGVGRAFRIAGSKTQVISLWDVQPEATTHLMAIFYKNLLTGIGKADAFRKAQLELIHSKKTASPFYWAGFILSGDCSALPPYKNQDTSHLFSAAVISSKKQKDTPIKMEISKTFKGKGDILCITIHDDNIYIGSQSGFISSFSLKTKKSNWRFNAAHVFPLLKTDDMYMSSLAIEDSIIVASTSLGVFALNIRTHKLLWKHAALNNTRKSLQIYKNSTL
ncbi:MAG: CHAT domain-containing tetratricopeptide repeat protein, partial [Bacteroidia bacterium]